MVPDNKASFRQPKNPTSTKELTLKQARKRARKTQEEVADHCGIARRHYQNIEYGETEPGITVALSICKFLGVSPYKITNWKKHSS